MLRDGKINKALRMEAGLSFELITNKDDGPRGLPTKLVRKNLLESLAGGPFARAEYSDASSTHSSLSNLNSSQVASGHSLNNSRIENSFVSKRSSLTVSELSKDTIGCDTRPLTLSAFIDMPMSVRLQYIEVLIYMSDYVQADMIMDQIIHDFKKDRIDFAQKMKPPEMLRMCSAAMYLL
jgi:hypothetical protein